MKIIIHFWPVYCFILLTVNQIIVNQDILASTLNDAQHSAKADKSTLNKSQHTIKETNKQANKQANKQKVERNIILVPPPPPEQPSFLDWSDVSIMPQSFNLLNEEELKQKLVRLRKEMSNASDALEENNKEVSDAKEKAEHFISLYSEGVVSRKELETAKNNVLQKERSLQEAKGKVEDLKVQENVILRRLANFKKNNRVKQHASKKKISNSGKQK